MLVDHASAQLQSCASNAAKLERTNKMLFRAHDDVLHALDEDIVKYQQIVLAQSAVARDPDNQALRAILLQLLDERSRLTQPELRKLNARVSELTKAGAELAKSIKERRHCRGSEAESRSLRYEFQTFFARVKAYNQKVARASKGYQVVE